MTHHYLVILPLHALNSPVSLTVVFIPKLDKPAYDVPKAHRPISLMNNIMKIFMTKRLYRSINS